MVKLFIFKLVLLPLLFAWQVQGGERQNIQLTERARVIQPANIEIQGNDPDNEIQPAMGYNVLDSTGQSIATLKR